MKIQVFQLLLTLLSALAVLPVAPGDAYARAPKAAKANAKADKPAKAKAKPKVAPAKKTKGKVVRKSKAKTIVVAGVADVTKDGKPNVLSRHGIVIDLDTEEVLWARQPDIVRPIASVSKLMASIVVVEKNIDLVALQTMSEVDERVARGGARSRLLRGYTLTNNDLLHAALMGSDNRAVSAMGRSVGLDAKAFAAAMSAKAEELGLKHTHFGDPTGLDARNVSTPREIVGMLRYALKQKTIADIVGTAEYAAKYTVGKAEKQRTGEVVYHSTDRLLKGSPYKIYGGKTGYTDEAKYCFVVAAQLDHGRRVAMGFLNGGGELTRFADFRRVATWLKARPPTAIARPTTESETTEPAGAVPYKDPATAAAAEASAPVFVEAVPGEAAVVGAGAGEAIAPATDVATRTEHPVVTPKPTPAGSTGGSGGDAEDQPKSP